jgi:uncharacterized paraquat-inducible protein A
VDHCPTCGTRLTGTYGAVTDPVVALALTRALLIPFTNRTT